MSQVMAEYFGILVQLLKMALTSSWRESITIRNFTGWPSDFINADLSITFSSSSRLVSFPHATVAIMGTCGISIYEMSLVN